MIPLMGNDQSLLHSVYNFNTISNRRTLSSFGCYPECVLQMFIKNFTILLASSPFARILLALSSGPDIVPRIVKLFLFQIFNERIIEDMEGLEPPSYQPDLIEN